MSALPILSCSTVFKIEMCHPVSRNHTRGHSTLPPNLWIMQTAPTAIVQMLWYINMSMCITHAVITGNQDERLFKGVRLLQRMNEFTNCYIYLSVSLKDA